MFFTVDDVETRFEVGGRVNAATVDGVDDGFIVAVGCNAVDAYHLYREVMAYGRAGSTVDCVCSGRDFESIVADRDAFLEGVFHVVFADFGREGLIFCAGCRYDACAVGTCRADDSGIGEVHIPDLVVVRGCRGCAGVFAHQFADHYTVVLAFCRGYFGIRASPCAAVNREFGGSGVVPWQGC